MSGMNDFKCFRVETSITDNLRDFAQDPDKYKVVQFFQ